MSQKVNLACKAQEVPLPLLLPWPPAPTLLASSTSVRTLAASSLTHSLSNGFPSTCCVLYLPRTRETSGKPSPAQERQLLKQRTHGYLTPGAAARSLPTVPALTFVALRLARSPGASRLTSWEQGMHVASGPEHGIGTHPTVYVIPCCGHQQGSSLMGLLRRDRVLTNPRGVWLSNY